MGEHKNSHYKITKEGSIVLTFGKHVDSTLAETPTDYLKWLVEQHVDYNRFPDNLIMFVEIELKDRGESLPTGGM